MIAGYDSVHPFPLASVSGTVSRIAGDRFVQTEVFQDHSQYEERTVLT